MTRFKLDPTAPSGLAVDAEPTRTVIQSGGGHIVRSQSLNDLTDVVIGDTPTDDQALAYDTATGKFIPQTIAGGGGGGSATNLAATLSAANTIITSDTGTDATIPAVDATNAGVMTPTQKSKLDGIATGATANSSDATLLARANHTGTQEAATISDFSAASDARIANAAGTSIASLSGGKVPSSQLPAVSLTSVQTAVSEAAQLALTTQEGDVVVRTDENKTYMRNAGTAGTMADFTLLNTPADAVTSVNGYTGAVTLAKGDVGLGNADNTSDASKPVSTATQTALDGKLGVSGATTGDIFVDYIGGKTDGTVDLDMNAAVAGNVTVATPGTTSTSVATLGATQTLTNKTLTSPAITTPTGIVKGDVGLGNVDNTSDATKNSATATLTNKTLSTGSVIDANVTVTEVLKKVYPVGSVYIAVVSTNPATLFGFGTWAAFATGRTLVGIDTAQTEFDTVEETGGAKTHTLATSEMPAHTHDTNWWATSNEASGFGLSASSSFTNRVAVSTATGVNSDSTGGGGAHNNLQPYIVTYMWKRTA